MNLRNLSYLLSERQNHKADCANFCGLLRKAEIYLQSTVNTRFKKGGGSPLRSSFNRNVYYFK